METAAIDARSLPPGTKLGKFALGERIARGGMAELYVARTDGDDGFEKLVALKLVLPQYKDDAQFLEMLRNEARVAAALEHPNIASVYDLGSARGEHFIAMEYVHGRNVAEILERSQGPLPLNCALALVVPACEAVHHAHDSRDARGRPQALIHRDISPSNVLIRYDGVVKLVDFGIAKATAHTRATRTGTIKGKMGYMSPEQCLGEELDHRTDVFALGVLLYELTTGQRPFVGGSDFAVMNGIISGEYVRPRERVPGYPATLASIIERALEADREDRFPSAQALRDALVDVAKAEAVEVSSSALAEWMAAHFDVPPPPVVTATAAPPTALQSAGAWGRRAAPYLAVAAGAGLLGFLFRPTDTPEQPVVTEAVLSPANRESRPSPVQDPPVAAQIVDPRPQPSPATPTPKTPAQSEVESTPESAEVPGGPPLAEAERPQARRRSTRRKPKPVATSRPQPAPPKDDFSLLPPSLR